MKRYYRERWSIFFDHLRGKLASGEDYADPTSEHQRVYCIPRLRATPFYDRLANWELSWNQAQHDIPGIPQGDTIEVTRQSCRIHVCGQCLQRMETIHASVNQAVDNLVDRPAGVEDGLITVLMRLLRYGQRMLITVPFGGTVMMVRSSRKSPL